jgi:glutaminyl-peptide cyclotransferase
VSISGDHTPFLQRGIPAVALVGLEHPDWHTTGDTVKSVSEASLERVGRVIQAFLEGIYPE